ncbi:MAG: HNH endonuclease [Myxococcales bacterium]|nr:HNH endonuclease [Myxococcales bacterium]
MSKYRFSAAQRLAVWSTFDGCCFWCTTLIRLNDMVVDHVVPETLGNDSAKVAQLKADYALPADFGVNDFRNWVPTCMRCNTTKGATLYPGSPAFLAVLSSVVKRGVLAHKAHARFLADKKKDKALGRLAVYLETGVVDADDVRTLLPPEELPPPFVPGREPMYVFTDAIQVLGKLSEHVELVIERFGVGARNTAPSPGSGWTCGHCGSTGPWSGARCQNCGQMSDD